MTHADWIDAHASGHLSVAGQSIPIVTANTVVVGTGAAGYCAADRLVASGIGPVGLTAGELIDSARACFNEWVR